MIMPKKVDHKERQLEITTAAIYAISARGLEEVRMVDIARAAGATTGSVVHYFEDKEAVLLAALDAVVKKLFAKIEETSRNKDLVSGAVSALPIDEEMRRDWTVWLQFWARAVHNRDYARKHEVYYSAMASAIALALKEQGVKGNRTELADAIIATVDGIAVRASIEPDSWPAERQAAVMARILRPMLQSAGLQFLQTDKENT